MAISKAIPYTEDQRLLFELRGELQEANSNGYRNKAFAIQREIRELERKAR